MKRMCLGLSPGFVAKFAAQAITKEGVQAFPQSRGNGEQKKIE